MIQFEIIGIPRPQGSKRHVGGGRMIESSKYVADWRAFARQQAIEAMKGHERIDKPHAVAVHVYFYLERPKSHFRANGALKDTAPQFVPVKPDGDKLERALLDSMTGVVFQDDCQVAHVVKWKLYGKYARTSVKIERL